MKILVIQLARLGDIYQTWPVLRALKRVNPHAELHFLTRAKFSAAAPGSDIIDKHWILDSKDILTPLIDDQPDIDLSLSRLSTLLASLKNQGFDRIVNLSFSPLSSFLVSEIAKEGCDIKGYSRFSDGYFSIVDDASAYFYAQAGVGRSNRIHVVDLFASVAGVDLNEEDWRAPAINGKATKSPALNGLASNYIAVHVGASDDRKTFSGPKWLQVVKTLQNQFEGQIVLIGSPNEIDKASNIANITGTKRPLNLVGKTDLNELVEVIRGARLLIGGDSGPMQIASLTDTPVFNISLPAVSFWETGPRSLGSRILVIESEDDVSSDEVVAGISALLNGGPAAKNQVIVRDRETPYKTQNFSKKGFEWELLRAIYMGEAFPAPPSEIFLHGMQRLGEVNQLAIEQIEALKRYSGNKTASAILDRVDEIIKQITKMVSETSPLVRWFETERLRIGPMSVPEIIQTTYDLHLRFGEIIALYTDSVGSDHAANGENRSGNDKIQLG